MPLIIGTDSSGGVTPRLPAQPPKRKKKKPEEQVGQPTYKVITVDAQMRNLSTAYLNMHGNYPSAGQAMSMLVTATGLPRSVADWEDLLAPGVKSGDWPLPGDAEAEVARREDEVDWDNISKPIPLDIKRGPTAQVDAPTPTDKWVVWDATGQADPERVKDSVDEVKRIVKQSSDPGMTKYDRLRLDYQYGGLGDIKKALNARSREYGIGVSYDESNDEPEAGLAEAFADHATQRQISYLVLGDDKQAETALGVLKELGVNEDSLTELEATREALSSMSYPDEELLGFLYGSFMFGRPLGQTERKARGDYAQMFGFEYLPKEAAADHIEETRDLYDMLKPVASAFEKLGAGFGWMHEHVNPVDQLSEQFAKLPGGLGEFGEFIHAANDATFNATGWMAKGGYLEELIPKAEQGAVTVYNMASMLTGGVWEDGALVTPEPEGLQKYVPLPLEIHPEVLVNAQAWAESWKNGEGRFIIERASEDMAPFFGIDPDNAWLRSAVTYGDFALMIYAAAKFDIAAWSGAFAVGKGSFKGARAMDAAARQAVNRLRVAPSNPRLAQLKADLGRQDGFINLSLSKAAKSDDVAEDVRSLEAERKRLMDEANAELDAELAGTTTVKPRPQPETIDDLVAERQTLMDDIGDVQPEIPPNPQDVEILARIKELGIKPGDDLLSGGASPMENLNALRGTVRTGGRSADEMAQIINSEFPGTTIHDVNSLMEWFDRTRGNTKRIKVKDPGLPGLVRRIEEIDDEIAAKLDADGALPRLTNEAGVGPEYTATSSGKQVAVRDVPGIGPIDADIAELVYDVNRLGFKTNSSHSGVASSHGGTGGGPREPYLSFVVEGGPTRWNIERGASAPDAAGRMRILREAADEAGFAVEEGGAFFADGMTVRWGKTKAGRTSEDVRGQASELADKEYLSRLKSRGETPDREVSAWTGKKKWANDQFMEWLSLRDEILKRLVERDGGWADADDATVVSAWRDFHTAILKRTGQKQTGSTLTHEEGVAGQQAMTVPGEKLKESQMDMGLEGGTKAPKPGAIPEQMPGQTAVNVPKEPTLGGRELVAANGRLAKIGGDAPKGAKPWEMSRDELAQHADAIDDFIAEHGELSLDDIDSAVALRDSLYRMVENIDYVDRLGDSIDDLAWYVRWAPGRLGGKWGRTSNPANMTPEQIEAYVVLRRASEIAKERGWGETALARKIGRFAKENADEAAAGGYAESAAYREYVARAQGTSGRFHDEPFDPNIVDARASASAPKSAFAKGDKVEFILDDGSGARSTVRGVVESIDDDLTTLAVRQEGTGKTVRANYLDPRTKLVGETPPVPAAEAVTRKAAETPPPPPEKPAAPPVGGDEVPPVTGPRPGVLVRNRAEVITFHTGPGNGHEYLIRKIFRIPDLEEYKPIVTAMVAEQADVNKVLGLIEDLRKQGGVNSAFDPTAPGLFDLARLKSYSDGLKGNHAVRAMSTPIGLRRIMPERDADHAVFDLGYATKLGKKKMDGDDARLILDYADRTYRAKNGVEKQKVATELCDLIEANMRAEGTWDRFEKFQRTIRHMRGKILDEAFRRRAYSKNDNVVPAGHLRGYYARRTALQKKFDTLAPDDAKRADLQAAIKEADDHIDQYRWASDAVNGKIKVSRAEMEQAEALIDDIASPQPVWTGQLGKNIRLPFDPRLLTWHQAGITARTVSRFDAAIMDRVMRVWKMVVMSRLGFPLRVFAGDEGVRLIAEGLIPFTPKWNLTIQTSRRLKGGKANLTKAERSEFKELSALDDLDEAQLARKTELSEKMKGLLSEGEMGHLHDESFMDWAEAMSDDWTLLTPENGTRYFKALRPHLNMLSREPVVRMFLGRKNPPKNRDTIREWLEQRLTSSSAAGSDLRLLLARTGRITDDQIDPKVIRQLLAQRSKTGASGNVNNILNEWTDVLFRIGSDSNLADAVRAGGRVPTRVLSRIDRKALNGWEMPSKAILSDDTAWWMHPMTAWYENVTMKIMEGASSSLRDVIFSHGYNTALDDIYRINPDIEPNLAHRAAVDRAFRYTDKTTFVRNPTIFEDLARNYIPFVNSYRQFWQYWLKMLAKHPLAMSAAYQFHPQRGELGSPLGPVDVFAAPMPFWVPQTEDSEGAFGMLANQTPGGNPFVMGLIGNSLGRLGVGDLSGLPFMSGTDSALAPASVIGQAVYALTGTSPLGSFGGDTEAFERRQWDLLKEYTDPKTGEVDWPLALKLLDALPGDHPELLYQVLVRQFGPASSRWRGDVAREVTDGYQDTKEMTPEQLNAYRDAHPRFDLVLQAQETRDPRRREELCRKHQWLIPYVTSTYDYQNAEATLTMADFVGERESGNIRRYTRDEWADKVREKYLAVVGDEDNPSYSDRRAAEARLTNDVESAEKWVEKHAKDLSGGSKGYYEQLIGDWKNLDPDTGRLPKLFHAIAVREAKQRGVDPELYERRLIPALLKDDFESVYGGDGGMYMHEPSQAELDTIRALGGVMSKSQRSWLMRDTPYADKLRKRDSEIVEDKLATIVGIINEPGYRLDSADLRSLGYKAGTGFDLAVHKWQDYYFNTYKPIVDKHGASSKEGKAAKLARDRFKNKVFANVNGGEAVLGGVPERLLHNPYFTVPKFDLRSEGLTTPDQQRTWAKYIAEASKKGGGDPKKLKAFHDQFTPSQETRFMELRRTAHHIYVAGMALWMRAKMMQSHSEYYDGPGNSRYSGMGQKMVAELDRLMRGLIRDDKKLLGASEFARDVNRYFTSTKTFSGQVLEWYD